MTGWVQLGINLKGSHDGTVVPQPHHRFKAAIRIYTLKWFTGGLRLKPSAITPVFFCSAGGWLSYERIRTGSRATGMLLEAAGFSRAYRSKQQARGTI